MKRVCVFCGSSPGFDGRYGRAAEELGRLLVARGLSLVYGGGRVGLMGVVADAVLAAGGAVTGVIPEGLARKELMHTGLTELHVVASMHARKAMMSDLADAFIALPGGFGTYEELLEMVTWAQLGIHHKPTGVLNVAGFYDALLALVARAVDSGFIRREHGALLHASDDAPTLLDRLAADRAPPLPKWLGKSES
jgi:uncharacterized protein (TIGR00730 family)